ncbi:hypothetical protein LTR86_010854 [Recurvomyces mirabilis]|nr:hypothetical protein LTR86_010854 [Recurvomyces mirabilis]
MAEDAIQSFLASCGQSDNHIPRQRSSCCCGNPACVYLKQNASALEGLEEDVRTAACLGQALLLRHETYIADSEREREAMMAHIEHLEMEKQTLEKKNASIIEENRDLLDQLEALNSAVADSDLLVTGLQATLQSTQQELQRLSQLAVRTERLEQQLQEYEREQVTWQSSVEAKDESEKSAVRRWQQAERTLVELNAQMERIEAEAKQERERHVEVVGRMERRRAVEKELTTAAGRLKGAAASKTSSDDHGGTNVVSHFVKDILSDNANLQMGIVELREMLQNSNDEVETLRRQLEDHQPTPEDEVTPVQTATKRKDLRDELQRASSQELHVHHHYHAPQPASKPPTIRRTKKKRDGVLTPGHFTPPSGYSTPRSSISYGTPSSAATILQQTAVSIPQSTRNRFSTQSGLTYNSFLSSSGPASPQSTTNRTSSMFERVFSDAGHESSRPTTPESEDLGSPLMVPMDSKRPPCGGSTRTKSTPIVHRRGISPNTSRQSFDSVLGISLDQAMLAPIIQQQHHNAIPEEVEGEWENDGSALLQTAEEDSSYVTSPLSDDLLDPIHNTSGDTYIPSLRRAASHESLLSISGMDIHTLRSRPSQLLVVGSAGRSVSSRAQISNAQAHATSGSMATLSRPRDSGHSLLSGMAAEQRLQRKASGGLGSKVGGWVFGRWGATPAPTVSTTTTAASIERALANKGKKAGSQSSISDRVLPNDPEATPRKPKVRPPGINQSGPIFGLGPEVKVLRPPVMKGLDSEGLRTALGD